MAALHRRANSAALAPKTNNACLTALGSVLFSFVIKGELFVQHERFKSVQTCEM